MPNIYAAGDVIGAPALASTSMEQGRLAARHAFGAQTHHFPSFYPIGIYTIPEISSCGYTENQLEELGFRYEMGRAYYYEIARNQIVRQRSWDVQDPLPCGHVGDFRHPYHRQGRNRGDPHRPGGDEL